MLKRPRAPSPSPTRPDPSSPPPLDSSVHYSFQVAKRRRIAGPALDSHQRRDPNWNSDDGEDDYGIEEDEQDKEVQESVDGGMHDKMYEHVNYVLHGLHAEQQHRSRAVSTHPHLESSRFYRDHHSPASSPIKYGETDSSFVPYRGCVEVLEDGVERDQSQVVALDSAFGKGDQPSMQDDERLRVTHRYEDTNRLLGSLILSRRRTLEMPSLDTE